MSTNKLRAKDLITIAIFTVVMILIYFVVSMTFGMIPLAYPFLVAVISVPGGIVWAYVRVKVPKRFAILIQCVVITLVFMLLGIGWWLALGFLAGGVLAELISGAGKYKRFSLNTAGFAALMFSVHLGGFLPTLIARDWYYDFCVNGGMTSEWTQTLLDFMSWPVMLITGTLAIVGAIIGMLLGRVMLRKHFERAGVV
jgi:energy-coupling factor transport system substrate-specific component